jgi:hypothetical protein
MAIVKLENPEGGSALVEKYIGEILAHDRVPVGGAKGARTQRREQAFAPTLPIPVYSVDIANVERPDFLSKAFQTGWRYFVTGTDEAVLADVDVDEAGEKVFAGVTRGSFAESLCQAALRAEKLFTNSKEEFYLRILEIPQLYLVALWMHEVHGHFERDQFVPAAESSEKSILGADTEANFVKKVRTLANKKMKETPRAEPMPF